MENYIQSFFFFLVFIIQRFNGEGWRSTFYLISVLENVFLAFSIR